MAPQRPAAHRVLCLAVLLAAACGGVVGGDGDLDSSTGADGTTAMASLSTSVGPSGGSISLTGTGETDSTAGPIPGEGPCCLGRQEAGCSDDPTIAACVCAVDRYCCENVWDAVCGEKVAALGCGVCDPGSTTSTTGDVTTGVPPDNVGGCCAPHPETGCELASLAECVCASEPACCSEGWDVGCVAAIGTLGCGVCPPDPTTTTTTSDTGTDTDVTPDNTESCCSSHASTGCVYPDIAECVCAQHPECCDTAWDEICIAAVGQLGCGVCPP
jgi:hypothetical protein